MSIVTENIINQNMPDSEMRSKIVVEISNRLEDEQIKEVKMSNAQMLDDMFFEKLNNANIFNYKVNVVKAFNLIDVYSLSSFIDTTGSRNFYDKADLMSANLVVPVCGNILK